MKILVIEDDPSLQRVLTDNLRQEGYDVLGAVDGLLGLERVSSFSPDLILLDIMLPQVNGLEICKRIREGDQRTPIIMLSARGEEGDVIRGLNLGANDYVTKPFRLAELLTRVKVHLRPLQRQEDEAGISVGKKTWSPVKLSLTDDVGREVPLTPKERKLLCYLLGNPDRIYTRDQLLNAVWGHTFIATGRNVDRCIASLRKKIEDDPRAPKLLKTVRGVGYKMQFSEIEFLHGNA